MIRLQVNNVRTIKELEIEFPTGKTTLLLGQNGAGKTNIVDAFELALFGAAYFIEDSRKANISELLRHGASSLYTQLTMPTFNAVYSHNGKPARKVEINGKPVESDRNDQHQQELMRHIGADRFSELGKAINRFFCIHPRSPNIFTLGSTAIIQHLLERFDFSRLQSKLAKAGSLLRDQRQQVTALEKYKIEGVEQDTAFLEQQIQLAELTVAGHIHYSRLAELHNNRIALEKQIKDAISQSERFAELFYNEQKSLIESIARLEISTQQQTPERELCNVEFSRLDAECRILQASINTLQKQLNEPLACEVCGAEHYYDDKLHAFNREEVQNSLYAKFTTLAGLRGERDYYSNCKAIWMLRDDLAAERKKLEALKVNQEIRRANNEQEIIRLENELALADDKIIDAEAYKKPFEELEELEDKLRLANSENEVIAQAKKQTAEKARLEANNVTLEFLVKDGIPSIIQDAVRRPLDMLTSEIDRVLKLMELEQTVEYDLTKNADGLPSEVKLFIVENGHRMPYYAINSQGFSRVYSFAGLLGEIGAFGQPFQNIENLMIWDDPLAGCGDIGELDLKTRLCQGIAKTGGGTRIIALADEKAAMSMSPDVVYRVYLENNETKVSRL